jgi:hypothetical protein
MAFNFKQGIGKAAATTFAVIGARKMLITNLEFKYVR